MPILPPGEYSNYASRSVTAIASLLQLPIGWETYDYRYLQSLSRILSLEIRETMFYYTAHDGLKPEGR